MRSDLDLLDAWCEGDKTAGAALFDRHFASLSRFFDNKAGPAADDLIQQTLLQCVESRDRFRRDSSFRTFLFAIARNVLHNHYRRKGRDRLDLDFGITSAAELAPGPPTLLGAKRQHRALLEALRNIPVEHQILLELYYWEKLSGSEIAAILEIPEGTVRTRLRRAKELVAAELERLEGHAQDLETTAARLEDWAEGLRGRTDLKMPSDGD